MKCLGLFLIPPLPVRVPASQSGRQRDGGGGGGERGRGEGWGLKSLLLCLQFDYLFLLEPKTKISRQFCRIRFI